MSFSLGHGYRVELARVAANATLRAYVRIDGMGFLVFAADGVVWTSLSASAATVALLFLDRVAYQSAAHARRAPAVLDVSFILVAEVFECRKDGIWRGLTQCAQ